jgi:hypothetical protein
MACIDAINHLVLSPTASSNVRELDIFKNALHFYAVPVIKRYSEVSLTQAENDTLKVELDVAEP